MDGVPLQRGILEIGKNERTFIIISNEQPMKTAPSRKPMWSILVLTFHPY